jgi:hypothetical protein
VCSELCHLRTDALFIRACPRRDCRTREDFEVADKADNTAIDVEILRSGPLEGIMLSLWSHTPDLCEKLLFSEKNLLVLTIEMSIYSYKHSKLDTVFLRWRINIYRIKMMRLTEVVWRHKTHVWCIARRHKTHVWCIAHVFRQLSSFPEN